MSSPVRNEACPSCGGSSTGHGTCPVCGTSQAAPERRVVTLLFADLVGYTRLCSSLDVEQVFLLVRPLMNALRRVCEDVGGVVPVIEGDGFMAVFGADTTHEDDPQRAVHAAARMQQLVQERRSTYAGLGGLRVGMNTGEVLVAPSWEASGFSVSGDPVNVASRLCGLADEGAVLAGATLASLVRGDLWGPNVSATVKNRDDPVEHCALLWRDLVGRQVGRRALSSLPYVRRDADAALAEALHDRRAVHLVGEPGAGKSRALEELAARDPDVLLLRSPSFAGPSARAQLAGLLLDHADDLPGVQRRALLWASGQEIDSTEIVDDGAVEEAVRALVVGRAVALDDAHLGDAADRALFASLATDPPDGTVVLLASRSDDARDLGVPVVELVPLDERSGRQVLSALLPGADERLVELLLTRSGGNPLYLEQAVQMLVEDGTVELTPSGCVVHEPARLTAVPVAMRLFVASRLDLLDDRQRDVLSVAAVVGEPVDLDLLRHLDGRRDDLPDVLEGLVGRGLLRWRDGAALAFKHQVVRDVAYEGQLRSRRVALHRAAAEWYAALPVAGLLSTEALHLEAAVALGDVDCQVVRRAVDVLGTWALSLLDLAPGTSLEVLDRADALVLGHPACDLDGLPLLVTRAAALNRLTFPEARPVADRAVAAAEERGDEALLTRAVVAQALAAASEALPGSTVERAVQRLRDLGDESEIARLELEVAVGDVAHSVRPIVLAAERAYGVAVRSGDDRLASAAAHQLAFHLPVHDPTSAQRWQLVAQGLSRPDDLVGPVRLKASECALHSVTYDVQALAVSAAELHRAGQLAGLPQFEDFGTFYELEALTELGRFEQAAPIVARARSAAERRPVANVRVNALSGIWAWAARAGHWEDARNAERQLEELVVAGGGSYRAGMLEVRGQALLARGHFREAFATLSEAVRLDEDLEQEAFGLRLALRRLVAGLCTGKRLTIAELQRVRTLARTIGAPAIAALAARWLELDEALHAPHPHALDLPDAPDLAEARALDLELAALRGGDPDALLAAAEEWATLGAVVWRPRALAWHAQLTGTPHPEVAELLEELRAPTGLEAEFRSQVRPR